MVTLFSMLFGAGIVLQADRAEAQGTRPARLFYRRAGVLLLVGLIHGYLIWDQDILFPYALCGMALYPLRGKRPLTLIVLGVVLLVPSLVATRAVGNFFTSQRAASHRVEAAERVGVAPSDEDLKAAEFWSLARAGFELTPEDIERDLKLHREGSYWEIARARAPVTFLFETVLFATDFGWSLAGRMLIGTALLKLGVFTGTRSPRLYLGMLLLGYGLGLPLVGAGGIGLLRHDFDIGYAFGGGREPNDVGSILVALGHVGAVVLAWKAWAVSGVIGRLSAVGRMALTNYLMQSLICTTLFYGYGLGLYGTLDRLQLLGVVTGIWALQLWASSSWLSRFRFGPAEWAWRSLTYGRPQPMR